MDWDKVVDSPTNMGQFKVFDVDQNSICQDHGTQAMVKIASKGKDIVEVNVDVKARPGKDQG